MPAVIFDFDGVIANSEPAHEAALRAALETFGLSFSPAEFRRSFLGLSDHDIITRVSSDAGRTFTPADIARIRDRKWNGFQTLVQTGRVPIFDATVRLLRQAAAAGPVAICSGALRPEIDLILARLGLSVPLIVTAEDTPASKPDPAPYLKTVSLLNLPAHQCVSVEDTAKGVRSATLAGCRVAAVCHSMSATELCEADLVVASSAELSLEALHGLIAAGHR